MWPTSKFEKDVEASNKKEVSIIATIAFMLKT
jgi:hypothetical protein